MFSSDTAGLTEPSILPWESGRLRSIAPTYTGWRDAFVCPQRMNDETEDRDANAGIGYVKGWPRVSKRHMQIEEQKIDHVSVAEAIGQISQNAGK